MISLPISNLNAWTRIVTGTGTVTIQNGGRSALFDGATGSGAQLQKNLALSPTGIYKVTFFARMTRGAGHVWIADNTVITNQQKVISTNWERYELTGSAKIFSSPSNSFMRINIGIATADDGAIEVSDVCVNEGESSFGSLKCIAGGVINLTGGVYTVSANYCGITSVQALNTNDLAVTCIPLHSSVITPFIFCNSLESSGKTVGRIEPRFYDKTTGNALFRFLDASNNIVPIATVNCAFGFKAETI